MKMKGNTHRYAKGTHRNLGSKSSDVNGLADGVSETAKVGSTNPDEVSASNRPKAQRHGSIAKG